MGFVRFVLAKRDPQSGVDAGLFTLAYAMRDAPEIPIHHREVLRNCLVWFETHLRAPDRFNRSKSKGFYRRKTAGIAWFHDGATECIAKMHEMRDVLEANGHPVTMIREDRLGYVVYQDELQVIAEPFTDTRTDAD